MIQRENRKSLAFGAPGLLLEGIGASSANQDVHFLAQFFGIILFMVGLGFYAKAKGRTKWWGLLGLVPFNILGIILLALLKDLAQQEEQSGG